MGLILSEAVFGPEDAAADTPSGLPVAEAVEHAAGVPGKARSADWLRAVIGKFDEALRRFYGVYEFSLADGCLLRIARARVSEVTWLADGSRLPPGTEIIDLHLWNERLSRLPAPKRGLSRAIALRRSTAVSLCELARHVEAEASFCDIAAIRAQTALVPKRRIRKLLRVAAAFGFEEPASSEKAAGDFQIGHFWHDLFILALLWTFNPGACRRNGLRRQRCELWLSRPALIARYGGDRAGTARVLENTCRNSPNSHLQPSGRNLSPATALLSMGPRPGGSSRDWPASDEPSRDSAADREICGRLTKVGRLKDAGNATQGGSHAV